MKPTIHNSHHPAAESAAPGYTMVTRTATTRNGENRARPSVDWFALGFAALCLPLGLQGQDFEYSLLHGEVKIHKYI